MVKKYAVSSKYKIINSAYPPVPKYDLINKKYTLLHIMFWILSILLIILTVYSLGKYFNKKKKCKKKVIDDNSSVESFEKDNETFITHDSTIKPIIHNLSDIDDNDSVNSSVINYIATTLPKITDFDKKPQKKKKRSRNYNHYKRYKNNITEPTGIDNQDMLYASLEK